MVCNTSDQAKLMYRLFLEKYADTEELANVRGDDGQIIYKSVGPEVIDAKMTGPKKGFYRAALILYDADDKEARAKWINLFKEGKVDLLIVYQMLQTGFDAPRLKRLYLGRKLKGHGLLQALTRVNRPYRNMEYGYVVDFADIEQNFTDINNAYARELNQFSPNTDGEPPLALTVLVSEKEVKQAMADAQEVLFDYTPQNAEVFAQEMEEIDDRERLIDIRHKLEEAKAVWNQVRTFGSDQLKAVAQQMKPGDLQNLLKVVNARIDHVNLKNAFTHQAEVSGMINEALATIDFKFRKRGEQELEIGTDIRQQMNLKRRQLSEQMADCIDQEDEEYVSLLKLIQEHFAKRKFEVGSMAEAKEDIGFMDQAMERIKEINRRNAKLQEKYRGDAKFVKAHKTIRRHEKMNEKVLLSEKEVEQCNALNRIKDAIDQMVTNRREIILNEPDFNARVIYAVAQTLKEIQIKPTLDDRRFIAGVVSGEYLKEYNVIG